MIKFIAHCLMSVILCHEICHSLQNMIFQTESMFNAVFMSVNEINNNTLNH
jgi:hypothetical protein